MTEREILISHILDLKEKSATESIVISSSFLSADELSDIIKTERINNQYVDTYYYGGHSEAERKVAIFVPKFYHVNDNDIAEFIMANDYNPIEILCVKKDRFSTLSHRDYLGAIMGLGLKRETVGDIVINKDGCFIFCLKTVSSFIIDNLKQAGRGQLSITVGDVNSFNSNTVKTETFFASVASLRLDCLVAAAFKLSRNTAVEAINQGLIYVNGVQILKTDFMLKKSDKLVFRGKGKTVIDEIIGENKKGRIHLNIKRYL